MDTVSNKLRRHHLIEDRKTEIFFAVILFVLGSVLMFDAFDARGKKTPWPVSVLMPW